MHTATCLTTRNSFLVWPRPVPVLKPALPNSSPAATATGMWPRPREKGSSVFSPRETQKNQKKDDPSGSRDLELCRRGDEMQGAPPTLKPEARAW